jgi:hypothetical protein
LVLSVKREYITFWSITRRKSTLFLEHKILENDIKLESFLKIAISRQFF